MQRPNSDRARWTGPILTVGELRRIIEGMADDTNVVIDDEPNGWYRNVHVIYAPPLDGFPDDPVGTEWQCLTMFPGSTFNARQI
jgi:hypothetical protein